MTSQGSVTSGITVDDLAKVSRRRAFFGRPSDGTSILQACAAEPGHLNGERARIAAEAWLRAMAQAAPR
jgi:hypothetical protein